MFILNDYIWSILSDRVNRSHNKTARTIYKSVLKHIKTAKSRYYKTAKTKHNKTAKSRYNNTAKTRYKTAKTRYNKTAKTRYKKTAKKMYNSLTKVYHSVWKIYKYTSTTIYNLIDISQNLPVNLSVMNAVSVIKARAR